MNGALPFLIIFTLLLSSCKHDICCDTPPYASTGKILGYDMALCACCGDYKIDIGGDAYDEHHYRFVSLPANSGIDLQNATYPIYVQFNWHLDESHGCQSMFPRIIIDAISPL